MTDEEKKEFKKERLERIKEGKGIDAPDLGAIGGLIETFTGGGESKNSCTCGENPHEAGCPLHVVDRIPIEVDGEDG